MTKLEKKPTCATSSFLRGGDNCRHSIVKRKRNQAIGMTMTQATADSLPRSALTKVPKYL
ncbi:MAG: hypothetical protein CL477_18595 [Acidobacteria bacterium]|nr:hypothetical protein [Acidobacteriota bacterium]